MGISGSDYSGALAQSDTEYRNQEKNSALDLCAEFYFRYRFMWYGENVLVPGRAA